MAVKRATAKQPPDITTILSGEAYAVAREKILMYALRLVVRGYVPGVFIDGEFEANEQWIMAYYMRRAAVELGYDA
jgi:hypothetical protein